MKLDSPIYKKIMSSMSNPNDIVAPLIPSPQPVRESQSSLATSGIPSDDTEPSQLSEVSRNGIPQTTQPVKSTVSKDSPISTSHNGKGINPRLDELIGPLIKKYGLKVTSGHRPNSKLKTSQHRHGNAYDISWGDNKSLEQRREVIKAFQEAGLTGIGVGYNNFHVDVGPKRHWTYNRKGDWISGMMKGYEDLF